MKIIMKYVLITFIVLKAAHEVQGETNEYNLENEGNLIKRELENIVSDNKETENTHEENALKKEYLIIHNKPESQAVSTKPTNFEEKMLTSSVAQENLNNFNINQAKHKICPQQNHSKAAKSFDNEILNKSKESYVIKPPVRKFLPTQRIYCRQTTRTEVNNQGEIMESIQVVCAPLQTTTVPPRAALPLFRIEKNCGPSFTSTPKGINCRRIMDSQLNDLGEIVDSVTEVCDPPTTTTTTTRRPIVYTWPITTTTTPKPLVKVCRPVMDSYIDEKGNIKDSVSTYCKMEQVS